MTHQNDLFLDILRSNIANNGSELHLLYSLSYLKRAYSVSNKAINGEILEIGSYPHSGFALALLLSGAKKVYLNNVTEIENRLPLSYAKTVYSLMQGFSMEIKVKLFDLVDLIGRRKDCIQIKPKFLELIPNKKGESISLDSNSLDMIFSISVLEHMVSPGDLIKNTFRMLKTGGSCYHGIDLRDHRDFSDPLAFLRLSEKEFRTFDSRNNRLRVSDYLEEFRSAGFKIDYTGYCTPPRELVKKGRTDIFEVLQQPTDKIFGRELKKIDVWVTEEMRKRFHPDFQKFSLAELSATGMSIVCHKEGI